jgi:hypothetical protein
MAGDFTLSASSLSGTPSFYIGMNSDPLTDDGYHSIDYALQIYSDGRAWLHQSGVLSMSFPIDGKVWIWRRGSTLYYGTGPDFATASTSGLRRGVTDVTGTLYFDSSFASATSDAEIKLEGP